MYKHTSCVLSLIHLLSMSFRSGTVLYVEQPVRLRQMEPSGTLHGAHSTWQPDTELGGGKSYEGK